MKIILASKSPRRKELMNLARFDYEIIVSDFDEKVDKKLSIEEQSKDIAYGKAKKVFDNTQGDRTVIGADTLVVLDGIEYGKPKNRQEAVDTLKILQGKCHKVYTSIAVLIENKGEFKEYRELHEAKVFVKEMTDKEIDRYVDSEMPFDKAGAYAIQSSFAVFIDKIEGDYSTVVGLPISRIYSILKENKIV